MKVRVRVRVPVHALKVAAPRRAIPVEAAADLLRAEVDQVSYIFTFLESFF